MPYHDVMQIREEGCRLVALCGRKKHCGPERSTLSVVHGILDTIYTVQAGVFEFQIKIPLGPRQEGIAILFCLLRHPYSIGQIKCSSFTKNSRRSPWTGSCIFPRYGHTISNPCFTLYIKVQNLILKTFYVLVPKGFANLFSFQSQFACKRKSVT